MSFNYLVITYNLVWIKSLVLCFCFCFECLRQQRPKALSKQLKFYKFWGLFWVKYGCFPVLFFFYYYYFDIKVLICTGGKLKLSELRLNWICIAVSSSIWMCGYWFRVYGFLSLLLTFSMCLLQGKVKDIELRGHADSVDQLCWDPKHADLIATASGDKTVRLWDARSKWMHS